MRADCKVTGRTDHGTEVYTGRVTNEGCEDTDRKPVAAFLFFHRVFLFSVSPPILEPTGTPRPVFTSFRLRQ